MGEYGLCALQSSLWRLSRHLDHGAALPTPYKICQVYCLVWVDPHGWSMAISQWNLVEYITGNSVIGMLKGCQAPPTVPQMMASISMRLWGAEGGAELQHVDQREADKPGGVEDVVDAVRTLALGGQELDVFCQRGAESRVGFVLG